MTPLSEICFRRGILQYGGTRLAGFVSGRRATFGDGLDGIRCPHVQVWCGVQVRAGQLASSNAVLQVVRLMVTLEGVGLPSCARLSLGGSIFL